MLSQQRNAAKDTWASRLAQRSAQIPSGSAAQFGPKSPDGQRLLPKATARMVFKQKPTLASLINSGRKVNSPFQFTLPDGSVCVGTPLGTTIGEVHVEPTPNIPNRPPTLLSSAETVTIIGDNAETSVDLRMRARLKRVFYVVSALNVFITAVLYAFYFVVVSSGREVAINWSTLTAAEVQLLLTLAICALGVIAVARESIALIGVYTASITLFYFATIRFIPFFMYSVRFIADIVSLYLARKLRSRLEMSWFTTSTDSSQAFGFRV